MESRSASVGDPVVSFYNKTSTSREFTDYGAINLGQSCPIATTDQEAEDNKFVANLVFEMPPQTAIEASKLKLHNATLCIDITLRFLVTQNHKLFYII